MAATHDDDPPRMSSSSEQAAQFLENELLTTIPLTRAMQLRVIAFDGDSVELAAPLAPNVNDKGCAFGSSLGSLMTLAGWCLVSGRLERAGLEAEVYVADSLVHYLAPLRADLEAEAWLEEGDWDSFLAAFRERGKARCRIAACVRLPDGGEATRFSGRFVALAKA